MDSPWMAIHVAIVGALCGLLAIFFNRLVVGIGIYFAQEAQRLGRGRKLFMRTDGVGRWIWLDWVPVPDFIILMQRYSSRKTVIWYDLTWCWHCFKREWWICWMKLRQEICLFAAHRLLLRCLCRVAPSVAAVPSLEPPECLPRQQRLHLGIMAAAAGLRLSLCGSGQGLARIPRWEIFENKFWPGWLRKGWLRDDLARCMEGRWGTDG